MTDPELLEKKLAFIESCVKVSLHILRHVVEHQLPDLLGYVATVRQRLDAR